MSTPNPFDKFDQPTQGNPFDQFDKPIPQDNAAETLIKRAAGGVLGDINQVIGAVNAPIKGLAGIAGLVKGALTPGESADNTSAQYMQSAGIPTIGAQGDQAVKEGMDASQATTGTILNAPIEAYRAGENATEQLANKLPWAPYVNNFINSHPFLVKAQAALKGGIDTAIQAAPVVYGAYKGLTSPSEAPTPPPVIKLARDNGVSVIPSELDLKGADVPTGETIEGFAGAPKTATAAAVKNTKAINSMGAQELASTAPDLGIKPDTELTPEIIAKAKQANVEPYETASNLSDTYGPVPMDNELGAGLQALRQANKANRANPNPDVTEVIDSLDKPELTTRQIWGEIQRLIGNAKTNFKNSAVPGKNTYDLGDLADAQSAAADLLEDRLDRFAQTIPGQENLVANLRQARVNYAKINAIDNSIKAGTTDIDPAYFGKQLDNGAPLTGKLNDIGVLANNFPKSVRLASNIANKTGLSRFDLLGGLYSISKFATNPKEAAAGTAAFLGGPMARSAILSEAYQNSLLGRPSNFMPMAPGAAVGAAQQGSMQQELYKQLMGQQ